jgi:hypothetical protein
MIEMPDFDKSFEYENNFYLSCHPTRIQKIIAQYELLKSIIDVDGDIIECGIFKGSSLIRFGIFREIFKMKKKIIGFDTFDKFPETEFQDDKKIRQDFIDNAGIDSISKHQLYSIFSNKNLNYLIELIDGNILETVPLYMTNHPDQKISLLNLDTDTYEPAKIILENFYPKLSAGGVLILDDYNAFPGETLAVNEFFKDKKEKIKTSLYHDNLHYIVKDD